MLQTLHKFADLAFVPCKFNFHSHIAAEAFTQKSVNLETHQGTAHCSATGGKIFICLMCVFIHT